jgi:hypothetical protein
MLRVHYAVPNQQQEPPPPAPNHPCTRPHQDRHTRIGAGGGTIQYRAEQSPDYIQHDRCNPQIYRHHHPHPGQEMVRQVARVTAVIAWGKRPVPFRTRKLRPTAPMVLHPRECGRVGHRRTTTHGKAPHHQVRGLPHLNHTPHAASTCRLGFPEEKRNEAPCSSTRRGPRA